MEGSGKIDFFISHSYHDQELAAGARLYLEQQGYRCWKAPDDIPPGQLWEEAIVGAIEQARGVLLIWTRASQDSAQVQRELGIASASGIQIFPLRLETINPEGVFRYYLTSTQWIDSSTDDLRDSLIGIIRTVDKAWPLDETKNPANNAKTSPPNCNQTTTSNSQNQLDILIDSNRDETVIAGLAAGKAAKMVTAIVTLVVVAVISLLGLYIASMRAGQISWPAMIRSIKSNNNSSVENMYLVGASNALSLREDHGSSSLGEHLDNFSFDTNNDSSTPLVHPSDNSSADIEGQSWADNGFDDVTENPDTTNNIVNEPSSYSGDSPPSNEATSGLAPERSTDEYLAKAQDLISKKGYEEDLIRLSNQVLAIGERSEAYFYRAYAKSEIGNKKGALADYTRAIIANPQDDVSYTNRGILKHELGNNRGAISDLSTAITLSPQDATIYIARGVVKENSGDRQGAMADYNQAIGISPRNAEAYFDRGNLKYDLGDKEGAISDYSQAIADNPQYADAYSNRANLRHDLGDNKGAIADYSQAIAINSRDPDIYRNRGLISQLIGDLDGACQDWRTASLLGDELVTDSLKHYCS